MPLIQEQENLHAIFGSSHMYPHLAPPIPLAGRRVHKSADIAWLGRLHPGLLERRYEVRDCLRLLLIQS